MHFTFLYHNHVVIATEVIRCLCRVIMNNGFKDKSDNLTAVLTKAKSNHTAVT